MGYYTWIERRRNLSSYDGIMAIDMWVIIRGLERRRNLSSYDGIMADMRVIYHTWIREKEF